MRKPRPDWRIFLDFAELHFSGRPLPEPLNTGPFSDLPPAHSWRAPELEARNRIISRSSALKMTDDE